MKVRNEVVNWKLVLIPVAVLSVAFAAGTKFFFGDGKPAEAPEPGTVAFGAESAGEPESLAARKMSASPGTQGSSLDMFLEVNKDYSSGAAKKPEASDARLAKASPGSAAGEINPYDQYARAQNAELEAPAVPELPGSPAPWMKGAPGTGTPSDPAASLKSAVTAASPESRKKVSSSRNSGRAGFSAAGGRQVMGRDRLGLARNAGFSQGSNAQFSANSLSNSMSSSGEGDDEGGTGLYSGGGAASSGGSSSQSGESAGGGKGGKELTTHQKEKPFPFLAVWPNQIDFGAVKRYETVHRLVKVMNTGSADLKIRKVDNLDPDAPFSLARNTCDGKTLKPGDGCELTVRFAPRALKTDPYISGFEVETDDSDNSFYNGLMEVKGSSHYDYWAYTLYYYGLSGMINRISFGQMSAGQSLTQNVYVVNTTSYEWRDTQLDKSGLPSAYSVVSENCSGKRMVPWERCVVTLKFSPTDSSMRGYNANYGKYNAYHTQTKARRVASDPIYPEVIESLNFSRPAASFKLVATRKRLLQTLGMATVITVPVQGEATARFPLKGALRTGVYWFFRTKPESTRTSVLDPARATTTRRQAEISTGATAPPSSLNTTTRTTGSAGSRYR